MTRSAYSSLKEDNGLYAFFSGRLYPLLIGMLVLVAYVFEIEFYTNIIIILALSLGLITTGNVRVIMMPLFTYIYQIPIAHSPGYPEFSDFYSHPVRLAVIILMFLVAAAAIVFAIAKRGMLKHCEVYRTPLLFSSILLSLAFLMNGAFGGEHTLSGLGYGALQIVSFFLLFYFFYFSVGRESIGEDIGYLCYCAAIIALVLFVETVYVYDVRDVISEDGTAIKNFITYGWGVTNTAGQSMTVLLPLLFLGAARSRYFSWLYLLIAGVDLVGVFLTLSRSSILLSVFAVVASVIMLCFFGRRKIFFRVAVGLCLAAMAAAFVLYNTEILTVFKDLIDRGFSDNNRFNLWSIAVEEFKEAPIFGKGFFSLDGKSNDTGEFLPSMVHNTVFQLLGSMGIVGIVSYGVYRIATLSVFLRHPSFEKTMLGISILTLLGQSLLDNFIFYFHPMFMYSLLLALAARMTDETEMIYDLYA